MMGTLPAQSQFSAMRIGYATASASTVTGITYCRM